MFVLFSTLVFAAPSSPSDPSGGAFVDRFVEDVTAKRADAALAACAPAFRDRSSLGCRKLVEAATAPKGALERGRLVEESSELLVELWLTTRRERTPIVLQARRTGDAWSFVDGSDIDSGELTTALSLEGIEDPMAPELPDEVGRVLKQLSGDSPQLADLCARPDGCEELASKAARLTFRAIEAETRGLSMSVGTIVLSGGRPVDMVWLRLKNVDGHWKLVDIDEKGLDGSG